jgi:hypothetical protein
MAFPAARVHSGAFGEGRQIGRQAPCRGPSLCSGQLRPDPQSDLAGPEIGLASFTCLYHSYRQEKPVPRLLLALSVSVFQDIMKHEGASLDPKDRALTDLVVLIAFSSCFKSVGEYTPPGGDRQTSNTQICRKDMQFWKMSPKQHSPTSSRQTM